MTTAEPVKKVWVVTAGSYSDYHIVMVTDDQEYAEQFAETVHDANDVEEWELSTPQQKWRHWRVSLSYTTGDVTQSHRYGEPRAEMERGVAYDRTEEDGLYVFASGTTEEEALKNATDYRAAVRAGQGTPQDQASLAKWLEEVAGRTPDHAVHLRGAEYDKAACCGADLTKLTNYFTPPVAHTWTTKPALVTCPAFKRAA